MPEINGALITGVTGIGTSDGDEFAYVECEFHDGNKHAVIFSPEMASGIISAFMAAAAHIQMKQAMRSGVEPEPIPVEVSDYVVSYGISGDGRPAGMLSAATTSGATFHLSSDQTVLRNLAEKMNWLVEKFDSPPPTN